MSAPQAAVDWTVANAEVDAAPLDPRIAAALEAGRRLDIAGTTDDHAGFAALLADDLVVNNPQNTISEKGATARLHREGKISYSRYHRIVEHAGARDGMVLFMGEERVTPKGGPNAG